MKFFQYPTTRVCILFLAMCLVLFACSIDGKDGGDPVQDPAQNTPEQITPTLDSPSGVTATANSASSITVSWEVVSDAIGYYIYRGESASGAYAEVGTATETSYTDNNLSAGTEYYYKVAAYNSGGTGSQSSYASATTWINPDLIPNPDPPTGVMARTNSTSSITIGWGIVSGATGYYIYRSTDVVGTYTHIGNSIETSFEDSELSAGTVYYYRVATYNLGGTGSQSSYVSAATLPNEPTGVTAVTASTTSITVSWAAVQGATGYYIYCSAEIEGTYTYAGSSLTTSYTNSVLSNGTTYYYKVAAYNSGGTGAQSSTASATTLPSAPTGVTAAANSASSITISWTAVSEAMGYYIYRSESSLGTYTEVGTSTETSYENSELQSNTTYYYKIAAYNIGGTGSQSSSTVSVTTLLNPPTGLTTTVNSISSITINWDAVSGATRYYIYRSESADCDYAQVGTYVTTTSYTDNSLSEGTTYYYKVAAYNISGIGVQSGYISTVTLNTPDNVTVASSASSITVSWGVVSGATGYYIYRSESASGTYTQVGTSTETLYEDIELSISTTYYYKVAAYNSGGIGLQSSYVYARTATTQCDDQSFNTVNIGTQNWMAENLNCNVSGSVCYNNNDANCSTYGRLYDWATAMNLSNDCNSTTCSSHVQVKHQGICPSGWHIPTSAEWTTLENYVGDYSTAGRYLKATSGWENCGPSGSDNSYLCEDTYGFTALPGGYGTSGGSFYSVGYSGFWWSASEGPAGKAYDRYMYYNGERVSNYYDNKSYLLSVRCIMDVRQ